MRSHPFTESIVSKTIGITLIVIAIAIQWGLLTIYGNAMLLPALMDSILSVGLLAIAGYMGWYILGYVRIFQVQLMIALLVQFICLGVSFMVMAIVGLDDTEVFIYSLPLRFLFGILCWIILIQWYEAIRLAEREESQDIPKESPTSEADQVPDKEIIDRISVKDGSRIHIVHIQDLFCIQASGDYVTLFTPSGQYIKEQTMKYFEMNLPHNFVRIHRSSIVNTEYILRMELYGKENYTIKLKNGTSLRASNSGYKLLKERLAL